jgi:O-antigen ligase
MLLFLIIWFLSGVVVQDAFFLPSVGVRGLSGNGNMLGAVMACLIAWALKGSPRSRWVALGAIPFVTYLVFSIGLRRNFVTTIVVLAGLIIFSRSRRFYNFIFLIVLALLFTYAWQVLLPSLPQMIQNRLTVQSVIETQGTGRLGIFNLAFDVWLRKPIFGIGFGDFGFYSMQSPITMYRPISAMNNFLLYLAELGILGFFLWTAAWAGIFYKSWLCYTSSDLEHERLASGVQFALVLFFLSGMMFDPFINFRLMWLAMGLPIVVQRMKLIKNQGADATK